MRKIMLILGLMVVLFSGVVSAGSDFEKLVNIGGEILDMTGKLHGYLELIYLGVSGIAEDVDTIANKECEWETYSQVFEPNLESISSFDYFEIPENIAVDEINVTKAFAMFQHCGSHTIYVNDVSCFFIGGGTGRGYKDMDCLDAFTTGLNKIEQEHHFGTSCNGLEKIYLEMEIKPANC